MTYPTRPRLSASWLLCILLTAALAPPALADTRVQIILDMSGSMAGSSGDQRKVDAARRAVATALESIPDGTPTSLRLYGHRVPKDRKAEACRDSELVIPFEPVDRKAILEALDRAAPLGQTPIEFTLHESAEDFGPPDTTEDAIIILISDGIETCGGDPARLARELVREGFQIKIFTVGFAVDARARRQLEAVSQATGAVYTDARDSTRLEEAVEKATKTALHGEVVRAPAVVPYAKSARVRDNVRSQCDPGRALAVALTEAAPNVQLVQGDLGRRGLTLEMEITEMRVPGGGIFSGAKSVTVEGTLRRGSKRIGSFRDVRTSLGGATGLFTGNCGMLEHAAMAVGDDVAAWLKAPSLDAELGNLAPAPQEPGE